MEATLLRNALRKLCVDHGWAYAVFWRLEGGSNSSHLVWGEGHHEPTVASASFGVHEDDALLLKGYGVYPGTYGDDTSSEGCQLDSRVPLLLEKIIKPQVHVLGHRFIGRAAITGNHQWILQNEFSSDGYSPEDFEELHDQFSAGIQTVAVIPVLPYGVVQVGSCQMVMKNTVFVNHVKCLFLHLGSIPGALASERNLNTVSAAEAHIRKLPILTEGPEDIHEKGPSFSIDTMLSSKLIFTTMPASLNQFLRPDACARMLPECSVTAGSESQSGNSRNARHYSYDLPDSAYSCGSTSLGRSESFQNTDSLYPSQFGQSSGGVTAFNPLFPDCNDFSSDVTPYGVSICNNDSSASKWEHWIANNYIMQTMGNQSTSLSSCVSRPNQLLSTDADKGDGSQNRQIDHSAKNVSSMGKVEKTNSTDVWFPTDNINAGMSGQLVGRISENDLYDSLGLESVPRQFTCNLDDEFGCGVDGRRAWELSTDFSACITKGDEGCVLDATHCSEIFSDSGHDQLLDAVVSKVNSSTIQSSDDSMSGKTTSANIGSFVVDNNHPSHLRLTSEFGDQLDLHGISPALKAETAESLPIKSCNVDRIVDGSSEDAHRSQISLWMESSHSIKNDSTSSSNTKKVVETGKSNRKRPKPGENPRPRPKDRQMIQDRVKELREIVPNGAKCSIDALLERTIKHMLFLQSVTKHADKLKETGEPKIINQEDGLLLKDNFEGGATWAFEVGSQSMTCPIIVEDLNPPRQLLVEMLCEDRGFFLEIADLIKGMGLTILKGIMEARNNKIWARFAVEANRDVTRMDIFVSLIKLLEPTALPNMTLQGVHGINSVHSMYCQSSIPASGARSRLQ